MVMSDLTEKNSRLIALHQKRKETREGQRLLALLPQGAGSGLNADTVDGMHAKEIVRKRGAIKTTTGTTGGGVTDHGALNGLLDDDHTQYHNNARGDARYFQESEFLNVSAGAGDAGKPIKLDAGGHVDATMINDADITPQAHDLAGAIHNADTLANLNTKVSDATLDDSSDPRNPNAHDLGGAAHNADTLANLNAKVSDKDLAPNDCSYVTIGAEANLSGETVAINASAGVGDAGKPIVLDAAGHVDASMINDADVDHGGVGGLGDDDHTIYFLADGTRDLSDHMTVQYQKNILFDDSGGSADAGIRHETGTGAGLEAADSSGNLVDFHGADITADAGTIAAHSYPMIAQGVCTQKNVGFRIINTATSHVDAGVSCQCRANSSTSERVIFVFGSKWTDTTDAQRDSRMWFQLAFNGSMTTAFEVRANDNEILPVITQTHTPASGGSGYPGQFTWDSNYFYVCYDTDTWGRIALLKGY